MDISGVYSIINGVNNKVYIGSSINTNKRCQSHFSKLKNNIHANQHLQNAYDKYGKNSFEFVQLISCPNNELTMSEQIFMNVFKPEYNIRKIAESNLGLKCSDETKEKIRQSTLGRQVSEENKEKLRQANLGKKHSKGTIEKMRQVNLGKKLSDETKEKIRKTILGRKHTDEAKEKMSKARLGFKHTNETKKKISKSHQKPVIQFSLNDTFIEEFPSTKLASKILGIHYSNIISCCRHKTNNIKYPNKTAGGYKWMDKEQYESNNKNNLK